MPRIRQKLRGPSGQIRLHERGVCLGIPWHTGPRTSDDTGKPHVAKTAYPTLYAYNCRLHRGLVGIGTRCDEVDLAESTWFEINGHGAVEQSLQST